MADQKMGLYKETTKWNVDYHVPNHFYILRQNKCFGYVREGTREVIRFVTPMNFDGRGRTFEKVMTLGEFNGRL
jgi:hypothetical protein